MTRDLPAKNEKTLRQIVAAIARSQGRFKLVLVRCDYTQARSQWTQRLTEGCRSEHSLDVPVLTLPETGTTLYSCIREFVGARGDRPIHGLQIVGLERLNDLDALLANANQVRENLREFPFPLAVWLDDAVLQRFMGQASDLFSWATTKRFVASDAMLTEALGEKIRLFFDRLATATDAQLLARADLLTPLERSEARSARAELDRRRVALDAARQAQLAVVFGRDTYRHGDRDTRLSDATVHLEASLDYWEGDGRSHSDAAIEAGWAKFYLALVALSGAETDAALRAVARDRFVAAAATFEQGDRADLAELCRGCSAWRLLEARLEADWADEAGATDGAIAALEKLRKLNPSGFPKLYLSGLERLQSLHYSERRDYLAAYKVQGEQNATGRRYGLRAFIGAGRLEPIEAEADDRGDVRDGEGTDALPPEIDRAGRGDDVRNLLERIGRNDCKLVVLNGPSGVGKSSLVNAGLVPALRGQTIGIRDVAVAVVRVYRDWPRELAKAVAVALAELRGEEPAIVDGTGDPSINLRAAFRAAVFETAARNEAVVFVLDQFEEFFFANPSLREHREFFRFIGELLDEPDLLGAAKVVLSLRDDYLHYLLVCNRMEEMRGIGQDVLGKNVLYSIGNLSRDRTVAVVRTLVAKTALFLEEGLLARFVDDLADEVGEIRPIELQIAGSQLQAQGVATLAAYEALATERESSKEVLVRGYLDSVVVACGEENHRLADLVLFLLTDERGTRPLRSREELEKDLREWGTESSGLELVLEIFVLSGLVVVVPGVPRDRFQLVHDYLAVLVRQTRASDLTVMLRELEEEREKREFAERRLVHLQREVTEAQESLTVLRESTVLEELCQFSLRSLDINEEFTALLTALEACKRLKNILALKSSPQAKTKRPIFCMNKILEETNSRNILQGHKQSVFSVDVSAEGDLVLSSSLDSSVRIWSSRTGKEIMALQGHKSDVRSARFNHDASLIASSSSDGEIKIWDRASGLELKTLIGHKDTVARVAFDADSHRLASASYDESLKIWDISNVSNTREIHILRGHKGWVTDVDFSPDGFFVVSGSYDATIKIWDTSSGHQVWTLKGHSSAVSSVRFSPDGKQIVSSSHDRTIRIWDIDSGKTVKILHDHSDIVKVAKFSPSGDKLVSGSSDKDLLIWETKCWSIIKKIRGHSDWVLDVGFDNNETTLFSSSDDRSIRIWDVDSLSKQSIQISHAEWATSASFSRDGALVASASGDGLVLVWETKTRRLNKCLRGHSDLVSSAKFSPDSCLIASCSRDSTIRLWSIIDDRETWILRGHSSAVRDVVFSPDGSVLASSSFDATVKLWDVKTGRNLSTFDGHSSAVRGVDFSADGKFLASASSDGSVKLLDVQKGTYCKDFYSRSGWVNSVSFSRDGSKLAAAYGDNTIKIWDVGNERIEQVLKFHLNDVNCVAFSPDSSLIASGSKDETVIIWDVEFGSILKVCYGHSQWVNDVEFSPDGKTVISASSDRSIRTWNIETLDELIDRACRRLTPWLNNPNGGATDEQRAVCDLPPRNPTN